jgi:hypothetical protein
MEALYRQFARLRAHEVLQTWEFDGVYLAYMTKDAV